MIITSACAAISMGLQVYFSLSVKSHIQFLRIVGMIPLWLLRTVKLEEAIVIHSFLGHTQVKVTQENTLYTDIHVWVNKSRSIMLI
jgi:hypothetical protein